MSTADSILAALAEHGPQTVEELARRRGAFRTSTFAELVSLSRAGRVVVAGGSGTGERYQLADEEPA